MSQLTFPLQQNELKVPAVISLNHAAISGLIAAGLPLPTPIWTTAIIDAGSSIICVTSDVLQKLGIAAVMQTTTQTAKGSASVHLFEISPSIPPASNLPGTMPTRSDLLVMERIDPFPMCKC